MTTSEPRPPAAWLTRWFPYHAMQGPWPRSCPSLHRWTLWHGRRDVYLHCWVGDDWAPDFHDHSRDMWSIGLRGAYAEQTPHGTMRYGAPWLRWFPAEHQHRIHVVRGPVWTLVVAGRRRRVSHFIIKGRLANTAHYAAEHSQGAHAGPTC